MRFAMLGSGSRGNATLVQSGRTCVMVDCGFSTTETMARLARIGVEPGRINAILVTHEHADHVSGIGSFARRYGIQVHCTRGTLAGCEKAGLEAAETFDAHAEFLLGDLTIMPLTVPHDAREPTQFVFADGKHKLGVLTDTGSITSHIRRFLDCCDGLILESNHDRAMLENGPYPAQLKARVGGPLGHLSNTQAAELLASLDCTHLQHLVAAHLSEKNNTSVLVREAFAEVMDCEKDWIQVASQNEGLGWRELI